MKGRTAVLVLGLVGVACGKASGPSQESGSPSAPPATRPHVAARIQLTDESERDRMAVALAPGEGAVWLGVQDREATRGWIDRIDPETNRIVSETPVSGSPSAMAVGFGSVWVLVGGGPQEIELFRLDPTTEHLDATVSFGPEWQGVGPIAAGDGAVWIAAERPDEPLLLRIDPDTGGVEKEIVVPSGIADIEVDDQAIWLSVGRGVDTVHDVVRVDPVRNEVTAHTRVGARPGQIAVGAGFVWASIAPGIDPKASWDTPAAAQRIDVGTNEIVGDSIPLDGGSPDPLGGPSSPFAVADGGVWLAGEDQGQRHLVIARLNLETEQVDHALGLDPFEMAVVFDPFRDAVWVAHIESVERIDLR